MNRWIVSLRYEGVSPIQVANMKNRMEGSGITYLGEYIHPILVAKIKKYICSEKKDMDTKHEKRWRMT